MSKKQYLHLFFALALLLVFVGTFWAIIAETAENPYISINLNTGTTYTRKVTLYIQGMSDSKYMKVSNGLDFPGAEWEPYLTKKNWYLDYGRGTKTVYVKFKDKRGTISQVYKDSIQLVVSQTIAADFKINNEAKETNSRYITLDLEYSDGVEGYIVGNDSNFAEKEFKSIVDKVQWILPSGSGEKTVYVQFLDANGNKKTVSNKIIYNEPEGELSEGGLIKGQNNAVYYFGYDGRLHPFLNLGVYHSWFQDFSNVRYVSNAKMSQYQVGQPVCVRPGTWLLKFKSQPKVYAVEPGCQLRPILSEAEAYLLYGSDWNKKILELDPISASNYQVLTYDVADEDLEIIDQDRDGVAKEKELEYLTSDRSPDTDKDGLTDLEEIDYWLTDPTAKDTDGDGYGDMTEILNGFPPAGFGDLNTLLVGTYDYSKGSVIKRFTDGKLYYRHSNGKYYYLGRDSKDKKFKSNRLDAKFIIASPFKLDFTVDKKTLPAAEAEIYYPTQTIGEEVVKL